MERDTRSGVRHATAGGDDTLNFPVARARYVFRGQTAPVLVLEPICEPPRTTCTPWNRTGNSLVLMLAEPPRSSTLLAPGWTLLLAHEAMDKTNAWLIRTL